MTLQDNLHLLARTCQSRTLRPYLVFAVCDFANDNPARLCLSPTYAREPAGGSVTTPASHFE